MIKKLLIKLIKIYQITPLESHRYCKYIPTCSQYAIDALEEYGLIKGIYLIVIRILKCNPFSKGEYDPVVKKKN